MAHAICSAYPTIQSLYHEYLRDDLSEEQKMNLLSNIQIEHRSSKMGNARSRRVYQLFTEERADTPLV